MATTIISSQEVAVLRPLWGKGAALRLWAEEGLVCWEDNRDKTQFGTMPWQEAARRVVALSDMVAKPTEGGYASERQQIQEFICQMEAVIRSAKEQGGPDDIHDKAEEHRRRRPKTVIMPQVVSLD
jgi:hypothetical protein